MRYLQLNDIDSYKRAFALSNYIWQLVVCWEWLAKETIGVQITRAVDSISANIAEGFGRYFKKDKIRFYKISFGSIFESLDWTQKAKERNLITPEQYNHILNELKTLQLEINQLIKYTNLKLKQ